VCVCGVWCVCVVCMCGVCVRVRVWCVRVCVWCVCVCVRSRARVCVVTKDDSIIMAETL